MDRKSLSGTVALIAALAACAEGVPTFGADVAQSGGGAAGSAGGAAFSGEACGSSAETTACSCAGGASGTKSCVANAASPTGFAFGSCGMCLRPASGGGGGAGGSVAPAGDGGVPCEVSACPMPMSVIPFVPPPAACCTESGTCGAVDLFGGCS